MLTSVAPPELKSQCFQGHGGPSARVLTTSYAKFSSDYYIPAQFDCYSLLAMHSPPGLHSSRQMIMQGIYKRQIQLRDM